MASIPERIWTMIQEKRELPALWVKENGKYEAISYTHFGDMLVRMTWFLKDQGISRGDKVVLMSPNRFEWPVIDLAIQSCGAVTVPLYPNLNSDSVAKGISHSEAKAAIFAGKDLYGKHRDAITNLNVHIYSIDLVDESIPHLKWLRLAKATMDERMQYLEWITELDENDLVSINYTSGTTGEPKGVMLTHKNIISDMDGALATLEILQSDRFLSFLPLSHGFERTAGYYIPLTVGAEIAYAESMLTVIQNANEISPTIITTVPRLLEKVYESVNGVIQKGSALKKQIFKLAMTAGKNAAENNIHDTLKLKLFELLVYRKIRAQISPRLRILISGGAPLNAAINQFFRSLQIGIVEGYGLTETSPIITLNPLNWSKPGSAGQPLKNADMKIAEDGEILVRGEMVMQGYFKAPDMTAEAIDSEKWFHTGDVGYLDSDNFLVISDRKKDLIVTAGGKNIAPSAIEQALVMHPLIEQAVVIGDRRKFISALIIPALIPLREKFGLEKTLTDFVADPAVIHLLEQAVADQCSHLSRFEQVKKVCVSDKPFTVENGELTATLKTRRRIIEAHYHDELEAIYRA